MRKKNHNNQSSSYFVVKLLCVLALLFGSVLNLGDNVFAEDGTDVISSYAINTTWQNDWTYKLDSTAKTIQLQVYNGSDVNYVVPSSATISGVTYTTFLAGGDKIDKTLLNNSNHTGLWTGSLQSLSFSKGIRLYSDLSYLFYGNVKLTSLDLSSFDTSQVTNMEGMFYNCNALQSLNVSSFDTHNVTNMSRMFQLSTDPLEGASLQNLDVSNFNTRNVNNMSSMFYGATCVKSLDLGNFDTSKVTDMTAMFGNCMQLASLNVSSFNTSKVTSMYGMFADLNFLKELDITSFDTSNVKSMGYMFNCDNTYSAANSILERIYISDLFTTKNVTDGGTYSYMFTGCNKLAGMQSGVSYKAKKIDNETMANWETGYLTIKRRLNFDSNGGNETYYQRMVTQGNTYGTLPTPTRTRHKFLGWYTSAKGGSKVNDNTSMSASDVTLYAQWAETSTLTFDANGGTIDGNPTISKILTVGEEYGEFPTPEYEGFFFDGWYTSLELDESTKVSSSTTMGNTDVTLYAHYKKSASIGDGNTGYFTITVPPYVNMQKMDNNKIAANIDVTVNTNSKKWLDISVQSKNNNDLIGENSFSTIQYNFEKSTYEITPKYSSENTSATTKLVIPVSGTDTAKYADNYHDIVNYTVSNFRDSKSYTLLSGRSFNDKIPENVTAVVFTDKAAPSSVSKVDMTDAQDGSVVGWLDGTTWYVSSQKANQKIIFNEDSLGMFSCGSTNTVRHTYNSIQFNHVIDTSEVTDMSLMFDNCSKLTSIDLSDFDTRNVTSTATMFAYCKGVSNLDLSSFDTSNVKLMTSMFYDCTSLKTISVSDKWSTENVSINGGTTMFMGCKSIVGQSGKKYSSLQVGKRMANYASGYLTYKG